MMRSQIEIISLVACVMLAAVSVAQGDAPPPPPQNVWIGTGQAGYTSSSGNSEGKSANAAIDMAYLDDPWKHAFHLDGLYGQSAGLVSAERWDTSWQTNYNLTPALYTFGLLTYRHDLFDGFVYQASASAGMGYKFIATTTTKLDAQVGVGYLLLRPEDITKNAAGAVVGRTFLPSQNGVAETAAVNYSQALSSTTTLTDKLGVTSSSADTLLTNTLAVAVKISTKLALSAGYALQDNTKPPAGLKRVDTLETLNLVYSF
jgi:putative salt-induced outer membrane protein